MNKDTIHNLVVTFSVLLLAISAIGYLVFPAGMLNVVGIVSDAQSAFLVRTLAAAFVAMIPMGWAVRRRSDSPVERSILFGMAIYMFLSSAVDLHAYLSHLVGFAAIPSIVFRALLGGVIPWLVPRGLGETAGN
jgi:hypothetical protein